METISKNLSTTKPHNPQSNPNDQPKPTENLIDINPNTNQNPVPSRFANDYSPQPSVNIKLKRKRSSSLCVENVSKLEKLISENSSSGGEDEYSEDSTSADPAVEYKLYMAFAPPIMRNGMEPARLEPKKYSDSELTNIISKHAYSGALLNGQYINPPKFFTKNTPLCDKVKNETDNGKSKPNGNNNNTNTNNNHSPSKNSSAQPAERSEHHRHSHRHYHHHNHGENNDNQVSRTRSNSRSPKISNIPDDSNRIDQRSNSIQFGGKGFFQKSKIQKLIDFKNSIRPTPPPAYQELQNDVLFKDDV